MNKLLALLRKPINRSLTSQPNASPLLKFINKKNIALPNQLIRLGTQYGGWVIPINSGLNEGSICYLAGAGEDLSFDCALVKRTHCTARIIDPTPRAIEHFRLLKQSIAIEQPFPINQSSTDFYDLTSTDLEYLSFIPVGLSKSDDVVKFYMPKNNEHVSCSMVNLQKTTDFFTAQCNRVSTIMANHGDTKLDLLKLDIEGAEYGVIDDLLDTNLMPPILLIEFDEGHTPIDSNAGDRIKKYFKILSSAGMNCIALDGCNATFIHQDRPL